MRWLIETCDGKVITEGDVLWPELPENVCIARLQFGRSELIGQESYGFQRYRIDVPAGTVKFGAQLIGVKGRDAIVAEVDGVTGAMERRRTIDTRDLTYATGLLRHGRR